MTSFDPHRAWRRTPSVVLRPEPFGALVYDFGSRRLSFLKDLALVRVVEALDDSASAYAALDVAGVAEDDRRRHLAALAALARSGMISPRQEVTVS
ncbi:mycofactocin biosynthesis chaperone MftB [Nocardioides nitrophenolicus]|uniref:mycofactocin biosynthesis chaperone MftB n=1 Tax=Nocardioides nitrophenolicus TaxID=60489 RepID=UPI00195ADE8A|nr:mycofactocin biosynthesis chaperone MftB [Nocardioides nitrophenolicus]MBM7515696.1 putative mycofactocin binding protein MftB [Nocardioides nitrophenolicus]